MIIVIIAIIVIIVVIVIIIVIIIIIIIILALSQLLVAQAPTCNPYLDQQPRAQRSRRCRAPWRSGVGCVSPRDLTHLCS